MNTSKVFESQDLYIYVQKMISFFAINEGQDKEGIELLEKKSKEIEDLHEKETEKNNEKRDELKEEGNEAHNQKETAEKEALKQENKEIEANEKEKSLI